MADEEPHDNLFESENLTLEVARKLIAALQQQNHELKELVEKLQGKNPAPRLKNPTRFRPKNNANNDSNEMPTRKRRKPNASKRKTLA